MGNPSEGKLIRIFIDEADKYKGKPLYEEIIRLAKEELLAGATAIKGFMGFGLKHHMHTSKFLRLSDNLPIIIEIIDTEEKINLFLPKLEGIVKEGLITTEKANIVILHPEIE